MAKINFTQVDVEGQPEAYKKGVAEATRQYCIKNGESCSFQLDFSLIISIYHVKIGYPYEERSDGSVQALNKPVSIGE